MPKPHVLFLIADQHRWDFMGYEHNGTTFTPTLDKLASSGTVFNAAHCTSPLSCPSRAAIACGRYGMSSGCFTNLHALEPGTPSFVTQFRKANYRTCAIGKTHMEIHAYDSNLTSKRHREYMDSLGWDEICEISANGMLKTGIKCAYSEFLRENGKFDEVLAFYKKWSYFMDKNAPKKKTDEVDLHEWPIDEEYQESTFVRDRALEWLQNRDSKQPFFLHVGFGAPHSPIEPNPRFMSMYRNVEESQPWGEKPMLKNTLEWRKGYRAMISQIDAAIGSILDLLEQQDQLNNTIIIYTADHGDMAGDHALFGKTCFFEGSVRVPLLFAGPGIKKGLRNNSLVELVDLGKTMNELCGIEPHELDQGKSLKALLEGSTTQHRDTAYSEMGCDRMIRDNRYKLMWGDPQSDTRKLGQLHLDKPVSIPPSPIHLYDMENDPHECSNLANDPAYKDILMEMIHKLLVRINENQQTRPFLSRGEYKPL